VKSEATVPNGHTIVVGGLQAVEDADSFQKVPILGDIPLLGLAFRKQIVHKTYKTMYLFITPCIMKCKDFSDLKNVSKDAEAQVEDRGEISKIPCAKEQPRK
jgi:general secretion pathway protein D